MKKLGGYIHIGKCGGVSIRSLVPTHESLFCICPEKWWQHNSFDEQSCIAANLTFLEDLNQEQRTRFYIFTFVRNPWDRAVSCWAMFNDRHRLFFTKHRAFEEFVDIVCDPSIDINRQPHHHTRHEWITSHECMKWHVHPAASYISYFKNNGLPVDFIGRFENFQQDWKKVSNILGITAILPHENKSEHDHYSIYYNKKTRQKIAELLKDDIVMFNYQFQPKAH